jgi:hypothetical protein
MVHNRAVRNRARESGGGRVGTEQVVFQGAGGNGLVHQQPLVAVRAVADEVDEVLVVELAELGDPGQELVVPLESVLVQLLDGHSLVRCNAEPRASCEIPSVRHANAFAQVIYGCARTCDMVYAPGRSSRAGPCRRERSRPLRRGCTA